MERQRAPRAAARRARAARQPLHGARFSRSVRIAARLAPSRSHGARAAREEQGVLHNRLERPRRQRDGRAPDAPYRSRVSALPLGRIHGRAFPQAARHGSDHGFGAFVRGEQGRSRFGRPSQSLGLEIALGAAANVDDRLASAQGIRHCDRDRAGAAHQTCAADSRRFDRDLLVRRCVRESRDRADRVQRGAVDCVPETSRARALRLRGQRDRHLGENSRRLDRHIVPQSSRARLFPRRRPRSRRRLRRRRARDPSLSHDPAADVSAAAHDADHGSRGNRFRNRMAQRRRARARRSDRPAAALGRDCARSGARDEGIAAREVRGGPPKMLRRGRRSGSKAPSSTSSTT